MHKRLCRKPVTAFCILPSRAEFDLTHVRHYRYSFPASWRNIFAASERSAAGSQPMHFHDRYTIVYNGEIYNYKEIREVLVTRGFVFYSQSDTEVILAAYALYKEKCVDHFDGMFAFAIWDETEQTLFAARDRFGEKPFFYCRNNNILFFASEIKALWAAGIKKAVNKKLLFNFLTLGYTSNPADSVETFFDGIRKLPAASYFKYHLPSGQLTVQQYWKLREEINTGAGGEETIEQFSDILFRSVKRRLRSDVTVGTSLSGGLDSSSIVAIMKMLRESSGDAAAIKTFSAVFPGYEKDESRFIQSVQQKLAIDNYQTRPTAESLLQHFDKVCYHQDEPFISSSIHAQYEVFALAKQMNVTVLLDGQGADETLAGYDKYYHWYWQELFTTDQDILQREIALARKAGSREAWNWKNKLAARFPRLTQTILTALQRRKQRNTDDLQPAFIHDYGRSYYTIPLPDKLENVLRFNTSFMGLEELLRYADRNSMAHGREVRLPFLSHELVEFIFSLPSGFKIKDAWTKWILRKSMENKLPSGIVWRTGKVGFEPPQKQWMENKLLQEYIRHQKEKLAKAGILQAGITDKIIKPQDAHAALNVDWRYLVAGKLFGE